MIKFNLGQELCKSLLYEVSQLEWENKQTARSEYFMSLTPRTYSYGNKHNGTTSYDSKEFTPLSRFVLDYLNMLLETEFNVCFMNRYENEQQHLGWHADIFPGMREDQPIAVLSLGAEREIWWKEKDYKGVIPPSNRALLTNGSVFVMPVGFQDTHFHKIPKHDKPCGVRISLTFRSFK
jgi:alkylated DNA repair dioxygenase AlkB